MKERSLENKVICVRSLKTNRKELIISGCCNGKIQIFTIYKNNLRPEAQFNYKLNLSSFKIFRKKIFLLKTEGGILIREFGITFNKKRKSPVLTPFQGSSNYAFDFLNNLAWGFKQMSRYSLLISQNFINMKTKVVFKTRKKLTCVSCLETKGRIIFCGKIKYIGLLNSKSDKVFKRIKYFFKTAVKATEPFKDQNLFLCVSSEPKLGIFSAVNDWKRSISLHAFPSGLSISGQQNRIVVGGCLQGTLLSRIDIRIKNIKREKRRILLKLKRDKGFKFLFDKSVSENSTSRVNT